MSSDKRVAVVTGAGRGIGRAVALRLAQEGHPVGLIDWEEDACKQTQAEIHALGADALALRADVSSEEDVQSAVTALAERLGDPVILVNNAGITRDNLLFKLSSTDWDAVLNVHLRGAYLMARACQTYMVKARWGRIVNMSSASALGNRGQTNYSTAKAGLQGFTKTLAIELGSFGVTVNAVAPGFIATEMTDATALRLGMTVEQFRSQCAATIPVGRVGQPEDVATAVAFFAADEASFVSGQILYVAGGPRG
jgi:3-oxoacyl-[acyl-carrier protein] reductase